MKHENTIFRQLLDLIPRDQFQSIVNKYKGDFKTHKLNCWTQFVSIFYAQLRQRNSLRDIELGLKAQSNKLYHLGIKPVKRSTLSDANNKRSYQIFEELFYHTLKKCKKLSAERLELKNPITSLDSTTITLCHSLFPWAKFQAKKGGLKLHLHYNHNDDLPEFITLTEAKASDLTIGRQFKFKPDSILVFDRGYNDYKWFYALNQQGVTFVCRVKQPFTFSLIGQHEVNQESNIIKDADIQIPANHSHKKKRYLKPIRIVAYQDPETGEIIEFLTNNETFKPETIALIYKQRWKIELFFKWIKQHLKIKTFLGTSKNAVFTQIWIAMTLYLLLWFIKIQVAYRFSLHNLSRIIFESAFEKIHLIEILGLNSFKPPPSFSHQQLLLSFAV